MTLNEFMNEITELMELETAPQLNEELASYSEWDSMIILSVIVIFDDNFGFDGSDKITGCKTFQDVVDLVSDKFNV